MSNDRNFDPVDDEPLDKEEEFELLADQCGSRRKGRCDLAGTEHCDFVCPLHNEVFAASIARVLKRSLRIRV